MLRLTRVEEPITLGDETESFTFAGHAFVRVLKDSVEAVGDLRGMTLKVAGKPKLILNGKERSATVSAGLMKYGD